MNDGVVPLPPPSVAPSAQVPVPPPVPETRTDPAPPKVDPKAENTMAENTIPSEIALDTSDPSRQYWLLKAPASLLATLDGGALVSAVMAVDPVPL